MAAAIGASTQISALVDAFFARSENGVNDNSQDKQLAEFVASALKDSLQDGTLETAKEARDFACAILQEFISSAIAQARDLLSCDEDTIRNLVENAFGTKRATTAVLVFLEDGTSFSPLAGAMLLRSDYACAYDLSTLIRRLSQSALDLARIDAPSWAIKSANEGLG